MEFEFKGEVIGKDWLEKQDKMTKSQIRKTIEIGCKDLVEEKKPSEILNLGLEDFFKFLKTISAKYGLETKYDFLE